MNEMVYLNGEFMPKETAKISPDDRGFIFADGVYEVAKYYNGRPFRYEDHIQRLERSLRELEIDYIEIDGLQSVFNELIKRNNLFAKHAGVYLQITRGVNKRVHYFPENINPTVYAFAFDLPSFKNNLENGIKVITHEDIRWPHMFRNDFTNKPEKIEVSKYFDVVNFARFVKVEGWYSWGYNDNVCPPTSTYSAYNVIPAKKELHIFQETQHWTFPEQEKLKNEWLIEKLAK
jgi:hypothetical protein